MFKKKFEMHKIKMTFTICSKHHEKYYKMYSFTYNETYIIQYVHRK